MSVLLALLCMASALEAASPPAITIDPCVDVDAEEVQRLTAIELKSSTAPLSLGQIEVVVACEEGTQEIRLTDREHGQITTRGIDLNAPRLSDRDAKARELALAIAELLRRVSLETAAPPPAPPPPPPPPPAPAPQEVVRPEPEARPWRAEVGAMAVGVGWTGGEALYGADVVGRMHLGRWFIADVRLGARNTRANELEDGSVDAHGVSSALGLAFDATPGARRVGASFGARLGADWLRYAAVSSAGSNYGGADATAVSLSGTTTAFVVLSAPLCLTIDASVGGALHSIAIEQDGELVSGVRGAFLSTALGLAAQF